MKSNNIKLINRKTPIIIYGAAGNGMRGYYFLKTINKYNVVGFFDKRASEIGTQYNLPVWNLGDYTPFDKEEVVVCVCVRNVFDHVNIVNSLISNGFKYIIFKPLTKSSFDLDAIERNYDRIFREKDDDEYFDLEPICKLGYLEAYECKDYAYISEVDGMITANIPFEFIYVKANDWINCMKGRNELLCSLALLPQIMLAKYFFGFKGDVNLYLEYCSSTINNSKYKYGAGGGNIKDTILWRQNIIDNRKDVFQKMNDNLELNYSFFVDRAPYADIDDNGNIVLRSAKHRAAFFITKNRKYMPLKLKKEEYEFFINEKYAIKLKEYLQKNHINRVNIPILHPWFYIISAEVMSYYESFFRKVILFLSSHINNIYELTFCDALDDDGMSARLLSKYGCKCSFVDMDNNGSKKEYYDILDGLYRCNKIEYPKKVIESDILFIDDSIYDVKNVVSRYIVVISENKGCEYKFEDKKKIKIGQLNWNNKQVYCHAFI